MPGSSPSGSRVIRRWGQNRRPRKNRNYRYRERWETDSVVGKLVEKKRLNNLVYVASMLQMGIQPEKWGARKKRHGGISLSRNWSNFFIFQVRLYTFLLYIGMNTESRGGQQTWPLSQSGASYKIIQRSYGFDIIFWPWDLLTFYGPFWYRSVNQKTYFSRGDFFLNQAPPSK